jgi:hypothetical protein
MTAFTRPNRVSRMRRSDAVSFNQETPRLEAS